MEPCLKCHICGAVIREDDIVAFIEGIDEDFLDDSDESSVVSEPNDAEPDSLLP